MRFLVTLILVIILIRLIAKYIMPVFFRSYLNKKINEWNNMQGQRREPEESIRINEDEYIEKAKHKNTSEEYTDYEEIE